MVKLDTADQSTIVETPSIPTDFLDGVFIAYYGDGNGIVDTIIEILRNAGKFLV